MNELLRDLDVLTSGALRAVPDVEGDRLPLSELVEGCPRAGRLVEEILCAIAGCDKPEPFVRDEPLDSAVHVRVLDVCALIRDQTGRIQEKEVEIYSAALRPKTTRGSIMATATNKNT